MYNGLSFGTHNAKQKLCVSIRNANLNHHDHSLREDQQNNTLAIQDLMDNDAVKTQKQSMDNMMNELHEQKHEGLMNDNDAVQQQERLP